MIHRLRCPVLSFLVSFFPFHTCNVIISIVQVLLLFFFSGLKFIAIMCFLYFFPVCAERITDQAGTGGGCGGGNDLVVQVLSGCATQVQFKNRVFVQEISFSKSTVSLFCRYGCFPKYHMTHGRNIVTSRVKYYDTWIRVCQDGHLSRSHRSMYFEHAPYRPTALPPYHPTTVRNQDVDFHALHPRLSRRHARPPPRLQYRFHCGIDCHRKASQAALVAPDGAHAERTGPPADVQAQVRQPQPQSTADREREARTRRALAPEGPQARDVRAAAGAVDEVCARTGGQRRHRHGAAPGRRGSSRCRRRGRQI